MIQIKVYFSEDYQEDNICPYDKLYNRLPFQNEYIRIYPLLRDIELLLVCIRILWNNCGVALNSGQYLGREMSCEGLQ